MGEENNRLATPLGNNGTIDPDRPKPASYTTPWDVKSLTPIPQTGDLEQGQRARTKYWNPATAEVVTPSRVAEYTPAPEQNDTRVLGRNVETSPDLEVIVSDPDMVSDFAEQDTVHTMRAMGSLSSMIELDIKEALERIREYMKEGQESYIFTYESAGQRFTANYSEDKGFETLQVAEAGESYRTILTFARVDSDADLGRSSVKRLLDLKGKSGLFVYLEDSYPETWKRIEDAAAELKSNNNLPLEKKQLYALAFLRDEVERHISKKQELEEFFFREE